jgi:uncharacterized protein (TIGR00369 family)
VSSALPGDRPVPPAVSLLGYTLESLEDGVATVRFFARPEFANLMGYVQGGFVAAMLDAAASTALLAVVSSDQRTPTVELKTTFLRPVPLGTLRARGRVVHRGATIGFLEASLYDPDETLLATMTSTARIVSSG